MIRENIDIEALLVRAYREKRVDRLGTCDADRVRRAWGMILLSSCGGGGGGGGGERVQTSGYATKLAARQSQGWANLSACARDGLSTLHDAVLDLPTFYVERLDGLDFVVWDAETAATMGHRIGAENGAAYVERVRRRGGQDPKRAGELRPAGPRRPVTAIVATNLMICHGRAADRPDVPGVVVTGRRPVYVGANKRAAGHEPVYETPLAQVVLARAVYAVWHACLGLLREACEALASVEVGGPVAPAAPWDEVEAPGGFGAPARRTRATGKNDAAAMA